MGVAVQDAIVKITGTKLEARGPVLITHWGLSGPAVIRLSAWQHNIFMMLDMNLVMVNWAGDQTETSARNLSGTKRGKEKSDHKPIVWICPSGYGKSYVQWRK